MSAIRTWGLLLLAVGFSTQEKTPDVTVKCLFSELCELPCSFNPAQNETVQWFKQDKMVYRFERNNSTRTHFKEKQLAERASVSPQQISLGNASLILKRGEVSDRGAYRCDVTTAEGKHSTKVVLMVVAPIRGLILEQTQLSGYEELKCSVREVYPRPRVTWETIPPTYENLRPVTRMGENQRHLYTVESRVRRLTGKLDLIYVCKISLSYGGTEWTSSLIEREIREREGSDVTIPCSAPSYMNNPTLQWTLSKGEDIARILTYSSQSGQSVSPPWDKHVELSSGVPFGDGSLRLMDPKALEDTGTFTCELSTPHGKHTERAEVTISSSRGLEENPKEASSNLWVIGVVAGLLILTVAAMLAYMKLKGRQPKPKPDPEEMTELNRGKDGGAGQ